MTKRSLFAAALLLALAGPALGQTGKPAAKEKELHELTWGERDWCRTNLHAIKIGMKAGDLRFRTCWGNPATVNTLRVAAGTVEAWTYNDWNEAFRTVILRDGIVIAIEDRPH